MYTYINNIVPLIEIKKKKLCGIKSYEVWVWYVTCNCQ